MSQNLPPLVPYLPSSSEQVIAEGQAVTDHLHYCAKGSLDADEMKARFEFEFGDPKVAKELWMQILEKNPNYVYALEGLARNATLEGELELATNFSRKALLAQPENPDRQLSLAKALILSNQADEAKEILQALVEAFPDFFQARQELGQLLLTLQDLKRRKCIYSRRFQSIVIQNYMRI